jgi:hypothetical protein
MQSQLSGGVDGALSCNFNSYHQIYSDVEPRALEDLKDKLFTNLAQDSIDPTFALPEQEGAEIDFDFSLNRPSVFRQSNLK